MIVVVGVVGSQFIVQCKDVGYGFYDGCGSSSCVSWSLLNGIARMRRIPSTSNIA